MIYYPYLTAADLGMTTPSGTATTSIVDPGTPVANIMVVVRDFVAVRR
jgi:hypothetical protein